MPVAASGVKPAQFYSSQHGDVVDEQGIQGENTGVVEHMEHWQAPAGTAMGDITGDDAGVSVDDHVEGVEQVVADGAVEHQPVLRSKRSRKPNSQYDPAVYDLDSFKIRGIPISGKKNGFRGIYWPHWSPFI